MKRIFLFFALALLAVSVSAQNRYYYDSGRKYGFSSNWKLSPFAQASFMNGKTAVGAGGIHLTCNFGKYSGLMAEGGYVALQNGARVDNMFQARIGYVVRPGIIKRDRLDIDITQHNAEQLGTLKEENALLRNDKKRLQEANDTLMSIQNRSLEMLARLEKRLDDCNAQVAKAASTPQVASPIFQIFFDYASSEISPIESAKVAQLAEYINTTEGNYRIEGYSSPDGDPYRNEVLSGERARAVYWLLISNGVDEDRIIPMQGGISTQYGEDSPLNRMVVVSASPY